MIEYFDSNLTVLKAIKNPHPSALEVLAAVIVSIAMLVHGNWELSIISIAILFAFRASNIELAISDKSLQYNVGKVKTFVDLNNIASLEMKGNAFVGKKLLITTKVKVLVSINNDNVDARQSVGMSDFFEYSLEEISDIIQSRIERLKGEHQKLA